MKAKKPYLADLSDSTHSLNNITTEDKVKTCEEDGGAGNYAAGEETSVEGAGGARDLVEMADMLRKVLDGLQDGLP